MQTINSLNKRRRAILVLELLQIQPNYAYQLIKHVSAHMSKSTLYCTLKGLEGAGFIAGEQIRTANSPVQYCYTLTASGVKFLSQEKLAYTLDVAAAVAWCKQTYAHLTTLQNSLLGK